ncbi:MAG: hypothetical protein HYV97_01760 [Bdellovibrio sp.]|nr:hypothetical protein [Bdellovibrio sp.]
MIKNVPEPKYRVTGMHIPVADIFAYLDRNGEASLYRITKEINITYFAGPCYVSKTCEAISKGKIRR